MMSWSTPFSIALEIASDVLVKGSVVLAVAVMVTYLLRTRSAAIRHVVWALAFGVLLTLPMLSAVLPSWRMGTLRMSPRPDMTVAVIENMPTAASGTTHAAIAELGTDVAGFTQPGGNLSVVASVVISLWLAGIVLILGRLALDAFRVRGITRRSARLPSPVFTATTARLTSQLGIRRFVDVLVSDEVAMPSSVGVWRPKVIVPREAVEWSAERTRTVLVHELAHVVRWDYVVHFGVEVVRAVYWLNPLVWVAARRLDMERERACDDQILRHGIGSADYATTLLEMARAQAAPSAALAMARKSGLEERVRSVMRRDVDRSSPTRGWLSLLTLSALVVALPVAAVEFLQVDGIEQSVEQLIERLRDDDPTVRRRAAWALGEREDRRGVSPLVARLQDESVDVRLVAAWALGEIKDRDAIQPLIQVLDDDDNVLVREMSALALGEIEDPAAVRALAGAFGRTDGLRGSVVWALGEINGEVAAEARVRAFSEWQRNSWDNDEVWVGELAPAGTAPFSRDIAVLTRRLRDSDPTVRRQASWNLGVLGDVEALEPLLDTLRDPDPAVRAMVVWALDEINPSRERSR
jgi:beta-lactamase regulating signal transducer with metallopeptidase domain